MKKIILSFIPVCLVSIQSFGQCCPYVDPIEILPGSPFDTDSIYVVTNVTTPNMGSYLGYDIIDQGSTIRIEACYFSGMLTALQTYTDTINVGVLAGGTYDIVFVAYLSDNDVNCVATDSNEVSSTVTVTSTLSLDKLQQQELLVYPNPVRSGMVYVALTERSEIPFRIVNTLGEVVLQGNTGKAGEINVSALHGVFYLSVTDGDAVLTKQIVVE